MLLYVDKLNDMHPTVILCVLLFTPLILCELETGYSESMTLVPWEKGRPLVWDATCVDTLAPSHLSGTSVRAGAAADSAEDLKRRKYESLDRAYLFEPFGVDTLGPWGTGTLRVFKILSGRLVEVTRDQRAGPYLGQRISIAIQHGNAASILGKLPSVEYKCSLPDVTSEDDRLDVTRFRMDFSKISEVKFPGLIGPLNERLICKIKCIDGNWVGPLCSSTPNGRFQPVLRECLYRHDHPLLAISFKNSTITKETSFPHGSVIMARCVHFGLYKLKGAFALRCENGEWTPPFPECVPTTIVTNFTGDAPPSIQYSILSGSATVEPTGELFVYPESSLRVDCVASRLQGDPLWTWTQSIGHYHSAWSTDEGEKDSIYRLTLSKMSARNNDQYTCTTPNGITNTIQIKVVNVVCPELNASGPRLRQHSQGSRLGHSAHFSCSPGFHLSGEPMLTCMGDGRWSSLPPTCVETFCPVLGSLGPHLSVVEYNSSFGGRAVFQCSWGYRLVGTPGLECEADGRWSGNAPVCIPIYCPDPLIPENGKLLTEPSKNGKFSVGDLMIYACDNGYHILGESSIVCTENGFWSHPPPFCIPQSEVRKSDTIYVENTTMVHVEE